MVQRKPHNNAPQKNAGLSIYSHITGCDVLVVATKKADLN